MVNLNVGSIPAGNDFFTLASLSHPGTCFSLGFDLFPRSRSFPFTGFVYVARFPWAPFPPGTISLLLRVLLKICWIVKQHRQLNAAVFELREVWSLPIAGVEI